MGDLYQHPQNNSWSADCPCGWSSGAMTKEGAGAALTYHRGQAHAASDGGPVVKRGPLVPMSHEKLADDAPAASGDQP